MAFTKNPEMAFHQEIEGTSSKEELCVSGRLAPQLVGPTKACRFRLRILQKQAQWGRFIGWLQSAGRNY